MSLHYARELLKISISQLCNAIGFDTTSEIAIDILVDVCERQFQYLAKQTSNLIQLNDRYQPTFLDLLSILSENNWENIQQYQEYMSKFQSLPFSQDIVQFPHKKRNQFYLRIPPKDSQQLLERDQNQSTDYIYDWLPLFPDQETPEQPARIDIDTTFDVTIYNDSEKKIDKSDSHHPLTLLSFLSKNGDEPITMPIGKRPNRSLPSILYRPRRLIEMEAAAAAAEKAKKEQLEKENGEKDQQQGPPPPLRLTIPKPLVVNDKPSLPIKKLTTTDGIITKKPSSTPSLNSISPSVNLGKKLIISPPTIEPNETHSQPNPITNSSEILSNFDKNDDVILDLSITPIKLPTLKLSIKNVSNPQIAINSETPTTATKKFQRTTKPVATTHERVNLKIRTPSLPLFGTNPNANESIPKISPPAYLSNEIRSSSAQPSSTIDNKQTTEIIDSTNRIDPSKNSKNSEQKKKKKKKKHNHDREEKHEKKIKKEQENNNKTQMETDTTPSTSNQPPPNTSSTTTPSAGGGGGLRLKIKFGTPTVPPNPPEDLPTSITTIEHRPTPEPKVNSIRIPLPSAPLNSSSESHPSIISTINRTPHRRKSGKVKRVPQTNDGNPIEPMLSASNLSLHEDNTVSIDDLPLRERTSPNKSIIPNIPNNLSQQMISTPIRKKSTSTKKKPTYKRPNNTVGVAVIEERRIHHDSQEKIWICPSCNRPDNGQEAMIACDLCDDWYHWECVGIVEEPPESIPWFCPKCHRSNSSTTSAQGIKPSASSKAKRKRASALYQQKQQQQYSLI